MAYSGNELAYSENPWLIQEKFWRFQEKNWSFPETVLAFSGKKIFFSGQEIVRKFESLSGKNRIIEKCQEKLIFVRKKWTIHAFIVYRITVFCSL